MRLLAAALALSLGLLCFAGPQALAQQAGASQYLVADARASGMGGAFTAIAEGGEAVRWNPGALGLVGRVELGPLAFAGSSRSDDPPRQQSLGFSVPFTGGGLGTHVSRTTSSGGLTEVVTRIGLGLDLARLLHAGPDTRWGLGTSVTVVGSHEQEVNFGSNVTFGTLLTVRRPFGRASGAAPGEPSGFTGGRFGFVVENVFNGSIGGICGVPFIRSWRGGGALELAAIGRPAGHMVHLLISAEEQRGSQAGYGCVFASARPSAMSSSLEGWSSFRDVDATRVGVELTLAQVLSGRVGHIRDGVDPQGEGWTYGAGLGWNFTAVGFRLDFANVPYSDQPSLRTQRYSLSAWLKSRRPAS